MAVGERASLHQNEADMEMWHSPGDHGHRRETNSSELAVYVFLDDFHFYLKDLSLKELSDIELLLHHFWYLK